MNEEKNLVSQETYQKDPLDIVDFVIQRIKDNPFAVTMGAIGVCLGILLDERRKIRMNKNN